jgi:23S rRNA pseudouridine2605 synthase
VGISYRGWSENSRGTIFGGMRLNKFLQRAGVASRRKADELIRSGRIAVNGRVVGEPWLEVGPGDIVTLDGRPLSLPGGYHYFKLYKPRGVTSTLSDPHARRTLAEFVPPGLRLFPVGRLDRDSEGLLLLTDDGELALVLSHPRYGVRKRYFVELDRPLSRRELGRLRAGVELPDGPFRPVCVRRAGPNALVLSLAEGRKREIRRGFRALGRRVVRLVRLSIGPLELGDLAPGELRELSPREVGALKGLRDRLAGAGPDGARGPAAWDRR